MNTFGKRLKELRELSGLSQDALAQKLHISRSRIGMYEQGRRQPDFEMLEAIADTFNVNMDYLLKNDFSKVDFDTVNQNREKAIELYSLYEKASPDVQSAVELLLRSAQHSPESQPKN